MSNENGKPKTYKEFLDEQFNTATANAENARVSAINTAQGLYSRALSGYGAQGEKYSNMGLKGSGYTQYLDGQAMAQRNAAIQSALNAEQKAVRDAQNAYDTSYMGYLQQQDQNRANAFSDILQNIGTYSLTDIDYLNGVHQFNSDQIKYLTDGILKNNNYTQAELDNAKAKRYIDEPTYETYSNALKNARFDPEKAFLGEDGVPMTAARAKDVISQLKASGYSDEALNELQTAWYEKYGVKWNNDNGFLFFGSTEVGKDGNNFSVKDADGKVYRVQYNGAKALHDEELYKNAPIKTNNAVFVYNGRAYIVKDGEVYGIEARDNSFGDDDANGYAALLKKLGAGV